MVSKDTMMVMMMAAILTAYREEDKDVIAGINELRSATIVGLTDGEVKVEEIEEIIALLEELPAIISKAILEFTTVLGEIKSGEEESKE